VPAKVGSREKVFWTSHAILFFEADTILWLKIPADVLQNFTTLLCASVESVNSK
jgi:hypothetical protein